MALQQTFTTPEGHQYEYIRVRRIEYWDREAQTATFWFDLWKDQAQAAAADAEPSRFRFRLRVTGEQFVEWFGNTSLSEHLILERAYQAAKVLPVSWWGVGTITFAEAVDV